MPRRDERFGPLRLLERRDNFRRDTARPLAAERDARNGNNRAAMDAAKRGRSNLLLKDRGRTLALLQLASDFQLSIELRRAQKVDRPAVHYTREVLFEGLALLQARRAQRFGAGTLHES